MKEHQLVLCFVIPGSGSEKFHQQLKDVIYNTVTPVCILRNQLFCMCNKKLTERRSPCKKISQKYHLYLFYG